jgi:hypothetical protein
MADDPTPQPQPTPEPTPEPVPVRTLPPPADPPPAAVVVNNGPETEEVNSLRASVQEKDKTIKDRENRINELEDENRQLKTIREPVRPKAAKWWHIPTLLDD